MGTGRTRHSIRSRRWPFADLRAFAVALLLSGSWLPLTTLEAEAEQSRAESASDFSTLSANADAAREAGRLKDAVSLYRKALALRPAWKEGWWALGAILYEEDSHAEAARAFRQLLALDPENGTAHLMLGLCEYQAGRDSSAMTHFQAARKFGVRNDRALPQVLAYHEAMLLLRAGRYERALDTLRPLVVEGVEDENLELALGMGVLLMRPSDAPADGSDGREIVRRAGRAERQYLAREFASARQAYAALMQDAPAFPNIHYAYGRFLLATEDLDSAIAQFLDEIARNHGHVRARVQVAAARYRVDSAGAIPFAREVVKLEPTYPFGHYLLGVLCFDVGDLVCAIPELEAAARMVPGEAQFQFALGNAYARAGRAEDAARARAAFTRLRKTDSNERVQPDKMRPADLDEATRPRSRN